MDTQMPAAPQRKLRVTKTLTHRAMRATRLCSPGSKHLYFKHEVLTASTTTSESLEQPDVLPTEHPTTTWQGKIRMKLMLSDFDSRRH